MTVRELIEVLSKMPPEAEVIYSYHSEYEAMDKKEVTLVRAEEKTIGRRHGRYMEVRHNWIDKREGEPEWATVVVFPGN